MTFRVSTEFDDSLLLRYAATDRDPHFGIWFDWNGTSFPASRHFDFGTVVLEWWLRSLRDFFSGDAPEAVFLFMEGPYELRVSREASDTLRLTPFVIDVAGPAQLVQQSEFMEEFERVTNKICVHLELLGHDPGLFLLIRKLASGLRVL